MPRYRPVDPKVNLPALEERVLAFWREHDVFAKSLALREGAPEWVFYEGPPTANGKPGIHHVEPRTFKDVYLRFRTMTGHSVPRKAGWDCHGLPVELEVEKEIGTTTKRDIEAFGVAEFNRLCRESVQRYVKDFERLTERTGFWLNMDEAYWTMDPGYVQSVWWSLKRLHEQGLLFEDFKSVAYCPRCGTGLSDAEVAQGYATLTDPSVYVRFPVTEPSRPELAGASFVGWTTTPWTLTSNLGLAVADDQPYVKARVGGEDLVVAEARLEDLRGLAEDEARVLDHFPGSALVGSRYSPPFENVNGDTHRVVAAGFVTMTDGTGVVHIAPGFGAEDLELGRREGWPVFNPVDDAGRFTDRVPEYLRGRAVKEADQDIIADLSARGLLVKAKEIEHTYPTCWRCTTPLLYVARTSWYVRTTARKEQLLAANEATNWYPDHIKHGRYGDWLENNVDWALSRSRYWGTPLPVWRCDSRHVTVVGSLAELSALAGRDVTGIDPHRPDIDEVTLPCPACGQRARRVPEVIDTWYDSGAMPFAQWGYNGDADTEAGRTLRARFPADFIVEAIDQTRGWFYSLMAEAVLLFGENSYRNVVCLGHIVDKDNVKMSKSLGNAIDPWEVINRYGADAMRWFFLVSGSPWSPRRVFMEVFEDIVRQFLLTLWNTYAFFVTYANLDEPDLSAAPSPADRPTMDRWVLSRLHRLAAEVTAAMNEFDATGAGRRIAAFVDELSNWYVRRSRRRFWDPARGGERDGDSGGDGGGSGVRGADKLAAYATLHECLATVAALMAPFTPFVAEELHRNLVAETVLGGPESVHLADFPESDPSLVDDDLEAAMAVGRTAVSLGRTVRNDAKVRVRQPLAGAVLHVPGDRSPLEPLLGLIAEELNVKELRFAESTEELAGWRAKPNFRTLGPKLGPSVKEVAAALDDDDGTVAGTLAGGGPATIALASGEVTLAPEDVELSQQTRAGWSLASDGAVTVALDLELTDELRLEGLARELVRAVQDLRKSAGLEVADRIILGVESSGAVAEAMASHRDWIAAEVLATGIGEGPIDDPAGLADAKLEGIPVRLTLHRA